MVKGRDGCGVLGRDAAVLSRGKVLGDREGSQLVERAADLPKAALELDGAGRDGA